MKSLHREFTRGDRQPNAQMNIKGNGANHPIQKAFPYVGEDETQDVTASALNDEDPIICRLDAINMCYRLNESGVMNPIGNRRLVRRIRV